MSFETEMLVAMTGALVASEIYLRVMAGYVDPGQWSETERRNRRARVRYGMLMAALGWALLTPSEPGFSLALTGIGIQNAGAVANQRGEAVMNVAAYIALAGGLFVAFAL